MSLTRSVAHVAVHGSVARSHGGNPRLVDPAAQPARAAHADGSAHQPGEVVEQGAVNGRGQPLVDEPGDERDVATDIQLGQRLIDAVAVERGFDGGGQAHLDELQALAGRSARSR